jgi:hypothetical protein
MRGSTVDTDRRAFLKRSATVGIVLASGEVLKAQEESPTDTSHYRLTNDKLRLEFDHRGLVSMEDTALGKTFHFKADGFKLEINHQPIASAALPAIAVKAEPSRLTYSFGTEAHKIDVIYELQPGSRFVSKQILVSGVHEGAFSVQAAEPLQFEVEDRVAELYVQNCRYPKLIASGAAGIYSPVPETDPGIQETGTKAYVGFLRMERARGLFALLQNPFFQCDRSGQAFSLRYAPEMEWQTAWGPFPCDRACLGPYQLSGRKIPKEPVPEWQLGKSLPDGQDEAEVEAVTECVRAFLMTHPQKSVRMHCGWYENDYQIDISNSDGREEYKRIIDATAAIGCDHLTFAPQNTGVSSHDRCIESWNGDYVTWLSLGQKIADGSWRAGRDPVPDSIQQMLDYARSKNVKLIAYAYPDLAFSQSKAWLTPNGKHSSLAYRGLQDWLIQTMVAFQRQLDLGGFFFDYVYLSFPGTSRYAQWFGWRRVQEELRRAAPDIVISGGAYHGFYGPWTHLAGNWPWPMFGDEQPESHENFHDLHFARVEAARMRYATFLYKNYEFYPTEALPGFISHQVPRHAGNTEQEDTWPLNTGWRMRNFDYLGWKYSVISSIGYAGINHVIAMLPTRDIEEFRQFSAADQAWLKKWLDWTDANLNTLRHTRLILSEPGLGKVDGSSAIVDDRGYIFLYNPNCRKVEVSFSLDSSVGLNREGSFTLSELYPLDGRLWGKPGAGIWRTGDRVTATLDGTSATVLSLAPAPAELSLAPAAKELSRAPAPPDLAKPMLFGAPGSASVLGGHLALTGVRGEPGTEAALDVLMPNGAAVETVTVNEVAAKFRRDAGMITVRVRFAGEPFSRAQQVGIYDSQISGGTMRGEFRIPTRIKRQLAARKEAWSMAWTEEDLRCSWLAPERLLLFVQMASPDPKMAVTLKISGEEITLQRAYASIRPNPRCFTGFYADVSSLEAGKTYQAELSLPRMEAGNFQGLFFENVETEYTDGLVS